MTHAIENLLIAIIGLGFAAIIAGMIIATASPYAGLGLMLSGSVVSSLGVVAGDNLL